ncbi:MAG: serine protease [Planctomycetota bacterium]
MRALLPALLLLAACSGEVEPAVATLTAGEVREVVFDPRAETGAAFRIELPPAATGLRVRTEGATHDVELYARLDAPPQPETGLWDAATASAWLDEDLLLEASDVYAPGTWHLLVALSPVAAYEMAEPEVRLTLRADAVLPERAELKVDQVEQHVLRREHGLRAVFRVALPDDFREPGRRLRLEAFSPLADVELVAGPSAGADVWNAPYGSSARTWTFERLMLDPREVRDELFLHVYAYAAYETLGAIPVRVLAATEERDDLSLAPPIEVPPAAAAGSDPTLRAIASTVSIFGPLGAGSGVVVSPAGLVLTNAHVVVGADEGAEGPASLAAGFPLDAARPPVPSVALTLLDVREDVDLALLRICGGLDGAPLPADLRFPHVELAPGRLPLGDELTVLGYPMTGGSGSLISITLTRGIVSGYSAEVEGVVYKTDAAVHSGVSGGACIDASGRLVGLPSASIADLNEAGGLGYVIPVDRLPVAWRKRIAR